MNGRAAYAGSAGERPGPVTPLRITSVAGPDPVDNFLGSARAAHSVVNRPSRAEGGPLPPEGLEQPVEHGQCGSAPSGIAGPDRGQDDEDEDQSRCDENPVRDGRADLPQGGLVATGRCRETGKSDIACMLVYLVTGMLKSIEQPSIRARTCR